MEQGFERVFPGVMGNFWPMEQDLSTPEESTGGYLRLGPDGTAGLETLVDDPFEWDIDARSTPYAFFGATTYKPAILLQVHDAGSNIVWGGAKSSVNRYRAYSAALSSIEGLNSLKVKELEIFFSGVQRWAGVQVSEENSDIREDGRNQGFSLKVTSAPEEVAPLGDGKEIAISSYWSVKGSVAARKIFAPVSIICRSEDPVELWDLLRPILRIQDLISLAYDAFVVSDGGLVIFDCESLPPQSPPFWNHFLMHRPDGVREPKSLNEHPMFWLQKVGGLSGIRKWIELSEHHPRFIKPIVGRFRRGLANPELRLMEAAAAIEYWRNVNKRKAGSDWASNGKNKSSPRAMADHVGEGFSKWVGNSYDWADRFRDRNNQLKHEASYAVDESEVSFLANIASRLLVAEALIQISGDESAGEAYLGSYKINNLGATARRFFDKP